MLANQRRILLFFLGFLVGFFVYKLHYQNQPDSKKYKIIPLKSKKRVDAPPVEKSLLYDETLADVLFQKVRIVCLVITMPSHKLQAHQVKSLWGKRCNKLIFFSTEQDPVLEPVIFKMNESRSILWTKTKKTLKYAYEKHLNDGDFFMKVDDDSYVFMENLRYLLFQYNPGDPLYFGHRFTKKWNTHGYMSGESNFFNEKLLIILLH
jgi:glycoprotein-N-acetylgalactosamine 3-beta-galactosyltransferase